jgi:hypothetical protein
MNEDIPNIHVNVKSQLMWPKYNRNKKYLDENHDKKKKRIVKRINHKNKENVKQTNDIKNGMSQE